MARSGIEPPISKELAAASDAHSRRISSSRNEMRSIWRGESLWARGVVGQAYLKKARRLQSSLLGERRVLKRDMAMGIPAECRATISQQAYSEEKPPR